MRDWNKITTEEHIEHLEREFQFDSSGTAKAVFELTAAYKALNVQNVIVPKGTCCLNPEKIVKVNEMYESWDECKNCGKEIV